MSSDMDQEIREAAGGDLQDNIADAEGTYQFGNPQPTDGSSGGGGGADIPGSDSARAQKAREEFPRASENEVIETAERAKAAFGGTGGGGGGGVESDADPAIATGQKPGMGSGESVGANASGATPASREDAPDVQDVADEAERGEGMTTGQKFASILSSDPNMKWESKIAEKMSGGDDENTAGI